jgi:hypothetical protein
MNPDGTHDSICARCYATIASAWDEVLLAGPENIHVCNPGRMLDLSRDLTIPISQPWRSDAA